MQTGTLDFSKVNPAEVQKWVKALELMQGAKHTAGTSPVTPHFDAGGIFSYPYSEEPMLTAIQQPMSFIDYLPIRPSRVRNSVSEILTSQSAATGSNPDNDCGDPMRPGYLRTCRVLTEMGHLFLGTETVSVSNVAMLDTYGARPRRLVNGAEISSPLLPDPLRRTFDVNSETAIQLLKLATQVKRSLATIECIGDESLTGGSRRDGWVKEFDGLDNLITNITDVSGEACPAASSLVETWGAAHDASVNGLTLPELMHDVYRSRVMLANEVGYVSPNLAWVMSQRLFYRLVDLWACSYASVRCALGDASNPISRQFAEVEALRNAMYQGRYLTIDGVNVPVLFTSGAEVDDATTTLVSPIYLLSMRQDHTYIEHYPYNHELVTEFLREFGGSSNNVRVSNNGLYLLENRANGACYELNVHSQMRLMIKARFLCARIDDVQYSSFVGYRDWDPDGSSWYSGGTSFFNSGV